jgi:hypothetical protein
MPSTAPDRPRTCTTCGDTTLRGCRPNRSKLACVGAVLRVVGIASDMRHHLAGTPAPHTPTQAHSGSIRPGDAAPTPDLQLRCLSPVASVARNRRAARTPVFSAPRDEAVVPLRRLLGRRPTPRCRWTAHGVTAAGHLADVDASAFAARPAFLRPFAHHDRPGHRSPPRAGSRERGLMAPVGTVRRRFQRERAPAVSVYHLRLPSGAVGRADVRPET